MPTSALGFVKPPIIKPFTLPDRTRRGIAAALGLPALPNIVARYIEGEIEVLKATSASVQPTIGDVQATIDDATKILSRANRALAPFTHPWSGIDHESLDELAPLAQQITEAIAAFRDAAASRSRALGKMRRLGPANRPLGLILRFPSRLLSAHMTRCGFSRAAAQLYTGFSITARSRAICTAPLA